MGYVSSFLPGKGRVRAARGLMISAAAAALLALTPPAALGQAEDAPDSRSEDRVVVTAAPFARDQLGVTQGSDILDTDEVRLREAGTLGELLSFQPGVSTTYFGPGAGRPVIRGLGGPRVRVLSNGIGAIDASDTSPDHAVAVDPFGASRIEILRGPATLLYGSSAAGGVVNVIDDSLSFETPEGGIDGTVFGRYATNAEDGAFGAKGAIGLGGGFVLYTDGFVRNSGDIDIPGFAESARFRALEEAEHDHDDEHGEEEEVRDVLDNSGVETWGASGGFGWQGDWGGFAVSLRRLETNYGIPGGHEHAHGDEHDDDHDHDHDAHHTHDDDDHDDDHDHEHGEEDVRIDLEQTRLDLSGEIALGGFFSTLKVRAGYADYDHVELEGSEVGTTFTNEGFEGRLDLVQGEQDLGGQHLGGLGWRGAWGVQARLRDFSAIGEEAFVPPNETTQIGLFTLQEFATGPWTFDVGARVEETELDSDTGVTRDFTALSASAGASFNAGAAGRFGVLAYRTERAPSAEELFSNGPHLATGAFELGDPTLDKETALGGEVSWRGTWDRFSLGLQLFYTDYEDFILEVPTGEEEDGLPVFQFIQDNATLYGAELEAQWIAHRWADQEIALTLGADLVRGETDGDDIPRLTPDRALFGLEWRAPVLSARVEAQVVAEQDRTARFELPTDGYTLINASLEWEALPAHATGGAQVLVTLQGRNLGDEEARVHTSFLKDEVPLPGRSIRAGIRVVF